MKIWVRVCQIADELLELPIEFGIDLMRNRKLWKALLVHKV
jgi:hypothetical protein